MHVICKLVNALREQSDREVLISTTLLPSTDWNMYLEVATSQKYYGGLDRAFFCIRPAILWNQIYRNDSIHFAYSNQSFLPLSRVPVAADTIWPTLSKDPSIQSELRETAIKDLDILLSLRHKELKKGGMFMFDLLATKEPDEKSPLILLNTVLQQFVDSGIVTQEERRKIAVQNCHRDEEVLNIVLDKHMHNFRIRWSETIDSRYPAWNKYLIHQNSKELAREYIDWLKEWTLDAIYMSLSENRTKEEKSRLVNEIYDEVLRISVENPLPLDAQVFNFILEKIR